MAKATLEVPFSSISGRLSGESEMYVTTRFGETVISTYPKHRDPKKITAHQRALNANFAQAVAQAKVELSDPIRRAYWQDRFTQYQRNPAAYTSASASASAASVSASSALSAPSASFSVSEATADKTLSDKTATTPTNKPAVQSTPTHSALLQPAPTQYPCYKTLRGFLIAQLTKQL